MPDLIDQPTAAPTRKVVAGTLGAAVIAAIMAALQIIRPDLALVLGPVITQGVPVIVGFIAAYLTRAQAKM